MQSLDALNLMPVWVNPEHLAATAKIILAGHRMKVLGVVDNHELVGIITAARTEAEPDSALVADFMDDKGETVEASQPLRKIAELFYEQDLDFLPVVDRERFRGIVTPNMLLKEMARSWDPLTELSWSDSLREWGVDNLKEGREITILFIDLDDFGNYNKKYGHIVGDRVLQSVANLIKQTIDPKRDLLVRYAGDEFAIGSLRDQPGAMVLAKRLEDGMAELTVEGSDEPVSFSIGVQGGKRTLERENVHYAATLDNLINLASRDTQRTKEARRMSPSALVELPKPPAPPVIEEEEEEITPETQADIAEAATPEPVEAVPAKPAKKAKPERAAPTAMRVTEVVADAADANSVTQVGIEVNGQTVTGVCPRKGGSVVKSVALATANAIAQVRPDVKLEIREVNLTESETGVRFISVIGTSDIDGESHPIGGVGTVGRNLYLTVAEATVQAFTNLEAIRDGQ